MLGGGAGNNGTLDPSTVFVDFLGPLGGATTASWTAAAANKAVDAQRLQIQNAVRSGFITRAAADWQVRTVRSPERDTAQDLVPLSGG